jgi:hypothetical protein
MWRGGYAGLIAAFFFIMLVLCIGEMTMAWGIDMMKRSRLETNG